MKIIIPKEDQDEKILNDGIIKEQMAAQLKKDDKDILEVQQRSEMEKKRITELEQEMAQLKAIHEAVAKQMQ